MKINKLTDYSIVIMTNMVIKDEQAMYTAKELSEVTSTNGYKNTENALR